MRNFLRSYWEFFHKLAREGLGLKAIFGVWGALGSFTLFRDELGILNPDDWKTPKILQYISINGWIFIGLILFIVWVVEGSRRVLVKMMVQNAELSKVDRGDLQRMLNGRYIGNHFWFANEGYLCKDFINAAQVKALFNGFVEMQSRAPKFALSEVRLQFMVERGHQKDFQFYYRDLAGAKKPIENMYEPIFVPVDENGMIALQLQRIGTDETSEPSSLQIWTTGWIK